MAKRPKKTVKVTILAPDVVERNQIKFGEWLKKRREELNLSLKEVAKAGKCSDSWLCQLENAFCDCTSIKAGSLPKLALAYRLPVLTILDAILGVTGCQRGS
jgi:transcriptional regulator with XRE-family HTH domain